MLREISIVVMSFFVYVPFFALYEYRCSRRTLVISSSLVLGAVILVSFWLMTAKGVLFFAEISFFITSIPTFIFFFILSADRGAKFIATFCLVDTCVTWIGLFSALVDHGLRLNGLFVLCFRLLAMPFIGWITWRFARKPYREFLHTIRRGWGLFAAMAVLFYVLFFTLSTWPAKLGQWPAGIPVILLVCALMPLIYAVVFTIFQQQKEVYTAQIQAQYATLQYESLCQKDATLRQLRHDMQNHLRTALGLIRQGEAEKAERYLSGLTDTIAGLRPSAYCADHVADITIGWYAHQFAAAKVPFTLEAQIPPLRDEAHADVCCLLSNALQNALEGSAGVADPQVTLRARQQGGSLILQVENRCSPALESARHFPTTKEGEGHGIGLISMRSAAERHSGYLKVQADHGLFRLSAVLSDVFAPPESGDPPA